MRLEICGLDLELTESLRGHLEGQLSQATTSFGPRVTQVRARVGDVNGPRGGRDKRCRVAAVLARQGTIVVEHRHEDLYAAITLAAGRLRRAIKHRLERHGSMWERRPKRPEQWRWLGFLYRPPVGRTL